MLSLTKKDMLLDNYRIRGQIGGMMLFDYYTRYYNKTNSRKRRC